MGWLSLSHQIYVGFHRSPGVVVKCRKELPSRIWIVFIFLLPPNMEEHDPFLETKGGICQGRPCPPPILTVHGRHCQREPYLLDRSPAQGFAYSLTKIEGWKMKFPFGMVPFSGVLLNFRESGVQMQTEQNYRWWFQNI